MTTTPSTTEIRTGTDVLRAALNNRARRMNTANLARDLGVPSTTLDAFIEGKAQLPPNVLQALAVELFGGMAAFDHDLDLLRPVIKHQPQLMRVPPPIDPTTLPKFKRGSPLAAPQPVKPSPPPPKKLRPGWVE